MTELGYVSDDTLSYRLADLEASMMTIQDMSLLQTDTWSWIDDYLDKTYELQQFLIKFDAGSYTAADLEQLLTIFPELSDDTDNLRQAIVTLQSSMQADVLRQVGDALNDIDAS